MIKILFVINYLKNGGPSRVVLNIINNLDKAKYDINVLTLKDKNDKTILAQLEEKNINIIQLNYAKNAYVLTNLRKIRKIINSLGINIAHSHGILPDIIISTCKCQKISTLHSILEENYIDFYGKQYGKLLCKIHENVYKKFDLVCCCSESVYNEMKDKIKNIDYVRNGIDFKLDDNKNNLRKELGIPSDSLVYIYSGRLVTGKRIVELVKLFNNYKNSNEYLLVLGTGPLYNEIVKQANSQIKVLGFKTNIYDYYKIADIYVSNSFSEGFSISVIEALGCGLHLLVSNIPSHVECFNINPSVYIGEYFDERTFSQKKIELEKKIYLNEKERLKDFQSKYLSGISMTSGYNEMYSKILDNSKLNGGKSEK